MKAFPICTNKGIFNDGMDLRDYFAAKALPLLIHASTHPWGDHHDIHAEQAYKFADAMMKAREVNNEKESG